MELTPKQQQAAVLIASCMPQTEIAERLETHPTTLCRWKKLPEFNAAIRDALEGLLEDATALALKALTEQLDSPEQYLRQNAARDILTRAGLTGKQGSQDSKVTVVFTGLQAPGLPKSAEQ